MPDAKVQEEISNQNALMAAADELFADIPSDVTLRDGTKVDIYPAKVKTIKAMTAFVQEFVNSLPAEQLTSIISTVSEAQQRAIAEGESPYAIDTRALVMKSIANIGGTLHLIEMCLERLGPLVEIFSSIKGEAFDDLELDEATLVAMAILGKNYHFFTQTVLPQTRAYIAAILRRSRKESEGSADKNQKQNTRK